MQLDLNMENWRAKPYFISLRRGFVKIWGFTSPLGMVGEGKETCIL